MNDGVYIEFLVEDTSGKLLLEKIMEKYILDYENIMYKINGFKGIGRLPKNFGKISEIKTYSLLNDLPAYLRGFNRSLLSLPCKKAIVVVVDCDDKHFSTFKEELVSMSKKLDLDIDTLFCIAIEEMESWLLGDMNAVLTAYPNAKRGMLLNYEPDSIIGTWEYLADVVYQGGATKLKRNAASYYEIGEQKCKWASNIGTHLDLRNNRSPSFNYFISQLDSLCS